MPVQFVPQCSRVVKNLLWSLESIKICSPNKISLAVQQSTTIRRRAFQNRITGHQSVVRRYKNAVYYYFITHPLIFAWFYWLLYVTWSKSPDSYHAITPPASIFVLWLFTSRKNSQPKNFNFCFLQLTWKETKLVLNECNDSDLEKLLPLAFFTMFTRGLIAKRKLMGGL